MAVTAVVGASVQLTTDRPFSSLTVWYVAPPRRPVATPVAAVTGILSETASVILTRFIVLVGERQSTEVGVISVSSVPLEIVSPFVAVFVDVPNAGIAAVPLTTLSPLISSPGLWPVSIGVPKVTATWPVDVSLLPTASLAVTT